MMDKFAFVKRKPIVLQRGHRPGDGIHHPSIGAIACGYCGALKGVPCRTEQNKNASGTPYTTTHLRRINAWKLTQAQQ